MTTRLFTFNLLLAFTISLFAYCSTAEAGTLTMTTETTVKTLNDVVLVDVRVWNQGNVAAHDVQVNVAMLGQRMKSPTKPKVRANSSEVVHFEKAVSGILKGTYPLAVIVDFHDDNNHPFSAISGTTFSYKEKVVPKLLGRVEGVSLRERGELEVKIKNLGLESKNIRATVVGPREISTSKRKLNLEIEPRGDKTIMFEVVNRSAMPGATYPVFCYLEYDFQDTHYTAVAKGVVKVAAEVNWFRQSFWVWVALAVLCGVVLLLCQLKREGRP